VLDLVERQGLGHVDRSLVALSRLTATFSAEFAVRPYLAQAPEPTWRALAAWVDHPDHHVRRWVSEGSRPRLPWGARLPTGDPSRGLALLERLVDDPSSYVGRSVANHLGDVAKDHPDRAVEVARGWWAAPGRRPTVEHGLRAVLKTGHAGALAVVGVASGGVTAEGLTVTPAVAEVGGTVTLTATLRAAAPGPVRVDVVWAWPGARGGWSQRVFRGDTRTLGEGEAWAFTHRVSLRPVTTRPLRPGTQRLTLRTNGADVATGVFLMKSRPAE
jgi:3-methyladenine DNA glycosylase AlkC